MRVEYTVYPVGDSDVRKKIFGATMKKIKLITYLVLALLLLLGVLVYELVKDNTPEAEKTGDYIEYETAVVEKILTDSCEPDPVSENHMRGTQKLTAVVKSGQYEGLTLLVDNTVGPIYGQQLSEGDSFIAGISTYSDGTVIAHVYEYERSTGIYILVALFLLATILVGGKVGARSLAGLLVTAAVLFAIVIPMILKGYPTILTTVIACVYITAVVFIILSGLEKKSLCAMAGTVAGLLLAMLFGMAAQDVLRIDGYRQEYAEALLQLRQTGQSTIGISGVIVAGVIISALGAVMDVSMSISSSISEIAKVGKNLSFKELFKSGMNIGRDMVGTMTNTLILAIIGSSMMLVIYIASLGLPIRQFLSSAYLSLEVISGLSSSIGVVLTVPLTALAASLFYGRKAQS